MIALDAMLQGQRDAREIIAKFGGIANTDEACEALDTLCGLSIGGVRAMLAMGMLTANEFKIYA